MAIAKKVATKTTKVVKKVAITPPKKVAPKEERQFSMPQEVKDWIERAQSIMNHQRGEIERLKEENKALKTYRKFAEHRILRSEAE
jgi:hypothetical protein